MSRWFRMYDEVLDDPKVQRLTGEDFKAWVNILCLASRHDGALPSVEDIAFALRLNDQKTGKLLARLVSVGLLDEAGSGFSPHGWSERQYKSDVSTERVKRFRKRSKKHGETVAETPPDTEADTESSETKVSGAAAPDAEAVFWRDAKAFLKPKVKGDPGALVNKWLRDRGKPLTMAALNAAQVEHAVDPIAYCEGYFRRQGANGQPQPVVPL
jgi:hypothetical protein